MDFNLLVYLAFNSILTTFIVITLVAMLDNPRSYQVIEHVDMREEKKPEKVKIMKG